MPEPNFGQLAQRLLDKGIQPRIVRRAVGELRDHYDDLVIAAQRDGMNEMRARDRAASQLGEPDLIVTAMSAQRALRSWPFRYPRVAVVIYPLACLLLLPAAPVVAGMSHASAVVRWGTSLLIAGIFTASLLLVLQLSILFG